MTKGNSQRIFLCHASEDKEQVIEVYTNLKKNGFYPWLDKMDLTPGKEWSKEIPKAIKNSRFIIIFFSKLSVSKRGYVQREFKIALDTLQEIPSGEIFVIPVRLDECDIPEEFQHIHYINLFESGSLERLLNLLSIEIGTNNQTQVLLNLGSDSNATIGEFIDSRDNQIYKTATINGKIWMAENIDFKLSDGCWIYSKNTGFMGLGEKRYNFGYGRLYTFDAALLACPKGWHLPTDKELRSLAEYHGGYFDLYKNQGIGNPNEGYKNLIKEGKSGFDAILGGYRLSGDKFIDIERYGSYWSSSERGKDSAWKLTFNGVKERIQRNSSKKHVGFSCRYVKD